jgi:hypothetical protein
MHADAVSRSSTHEVALAATAATLRNEMQALAVTDADARLLLEQQITATIADVEAQAEKRAAAAAASQSAAMHALNSKLDEQEDVRQQKLNALIEESAALRALTGENWLRMIDAHTCLHMHAHAYSQAVFTAFYSLPSPRSFLSPHSFHSLQRRCVRRSAPTLSRACRRRSTTLVAA